MTPTAIIASFALPRQAHEPEGYESLFTAFELGWEVTTTHLLAKHMFAAGLATPETHFIVTLAGREFLYGDLPVMTWQDFHTRTGYDPRRNISGSVIDLAYQFAAWDVDGCAHKVFHGAPWLGYRFASDADFVRERIRTKLPANHEPFEDFAVACWRYRDGHHAVRNTPKEVADSINAALVARGLRVYVVGLGCEPLCNGATIIHATLPEMAWLVQQENCRRIVGAMTGTTQLAALISSAPVLVYQHNPRQPVNCQNHPAVLGECVNLFGGTRAVWFADETPVADFIAELGIP